MRTAYLVLFINTRTLLVCSAGLYSEAKPSLTASGPYYAVEIMHVTERNYEDACATIRRSIATPNSPLAWVLPLLENRT